MKVWGFGVGVLYRVLGLYLTRLTLRALNVLAEALGAIGDPADLPLQKEISGHAAIEVNFPLWLEICAEPWILLYDIYRCTRIMWVFIKVWFFSTLTRNIIPDQIFLIEQIISKCSPEYYHNRQCVPYIHMSFQMKRLLNSSSFIVVKVIRVTPWSECKSYRVIDTLAIHCHCASNNSLTIHCDCAHIIIYPIMVWSLACLQMVSLHYITA